MLLYCPASHFCFILSGLLLQIHCYYYSRNIFNASNVRVFVAADHCVGDTSLNIAFLNKCEYTASPAKCLRATKLQYFDDDVCLSCSDP